MRVLPVELAPETVDALEVERELLGFESRSAYVRWLLANRGSIATDDGATVLDAYRERIARLEAALEGAESTSASVAELESGVAKGQAAVGDGGEPTSREEAGGWKRSGADPTVEVRGSPRRTVRAGSPGTESEGDRQTAEADAATTDSTDVEPRAHGHRDDEPPRRLSFEEDAARLEEAIESTNLRPERVERVREDPVSEDAGVLGSVEGGRLDELARRAVAKTRKRLDRDVQTGLEYAASTGLEAEDVRPGEDVVDLDSLSVPGRSEDVVERRRVAAGRAIAYLRDAGRARKSAFVEACYEECPAGYDTADGWWRCVKTALKQVESIEGGDGARVWRYRP